MTAVEGRSSGQPSTIRLDKWLFQARICKSRGIAADFVSAGAVRVNAARVTKPATPIRIGDGLSFVYSGRLRVLRVRALGTRRGPAEEAQALYDDLDVPETPSALEPDRQADR